MTRNMAGFYNRTHPITDFVFMAMTDLSYKTIHHGLGKCFKYGVTITRFYRGSLQYVMYRSLIEFFIVKTGKCVRVKEERKEMFIAP